MEQTESSLPYSQAPATCPYPEPTPSSPTTPSHFLKIHLNIILQSMSWSPNRLFPSGFPTKTLEAHTVLVLFDFNLFSGQTGISTVRNWFPPTMSQFIPFRLQEVGLRLTTVRSVTVASRKHVVGAGRAFTFRYWTHSLAEKLQKGTNSTSST